MKLIRFKTAMTPHNAGETRYVPDDVAARMIAADEAEAVESIFDRLNPPHPQKPKRPVLRPARQAGSPDSRLAR